jgi:bifunctional UDP-N-acetylglucosamine pyrophosphorylase/glucosamine-1-phosphate N-acetyltransferase
VELEPDVFMEPGVQVWGRSKIASCVRVGAYSILRDVSIGEGAVVYGPSVVSDARIGRNAEIGPFAVLRGGTEIDDGAKVGRFVEIKKSGVGPDSKVPHLSYIGDAQIGEGTNIGAGTITCNYDGKDKHRTTIGSRCFVGSDTMFVAPVSMGDDSFTAAGSVVTKDIPDGALAIARPRQDNIAEWSRRMKIDENHKKDNGEN